jgi:hypothetical protein
MNGCQSVHVAALVSRGFGAELGRRGQNARLRGHCAYNSSVNFAIRPGRHRTTLCHACNWSVLGQCHHGLYADPGARRDSVEAERQRRPLSLDHFNGAVECAKIKRRGP